MLTHQLKFKKINEMLQSLANVSKANPKNAFWDLSKNIRTLKELTESVQEQIVDIRKEFVDKDANGTPIEVDGKDDMQGKKVTEISDPAKKAQFADIILQAENDIYEVKLHRILNSSIQEEITAGKINPVDVSFLLGYVFVDTEEQQKKTGDATPSDIYLGDVPKLPVIGKKKLELVTKK